MDIIVGGPLKPNGQNVPTRVGEIVSDYAELANIPNPRVGMEVWVEKEKMAVRILTLKEATIAGVVVPNAVVDTWEIVPNRAMTTALATKISEEEQRATLAENALRGKVADFENNYFAKMGELDTEVENLHSEDANLQSNINEIQLDLQSKINELGQEYLKGIEDANRNIERIDTAAVGSLQVDADAEKVTIKGTSLSDAEVAAVDIPAATTESAGVMTAVQCQNLATLIIQMQDLIARVEALENPGVVAEVSSNVLTITNGAEVDANNLLLTGNNIDITNNNLNIN